MTTTSTTTKPEKMTASDLVIYTALIIQGLIAINLTYRIRALEAKQPSAISKHTVVTTTAATKTSLDLNCSLATPQENTQHESKQFFDVFQVMPFSPPTI